VIVTGSKPFQHSRPKLSGDSAGHSVDFLPVFVLTYWSQNGAKQGSTNLPAEICLNKITVSMGSRSSTRIPSALMEHAPPACEHAPRLVKQTGVFGAVIKSGNVFQPIEQGLAVPGQAEAELSNVSGALT
jgi:hypothetical protein